MAENLKQPLRSLLNRQLVIGKTPSMRDPASDFSKDVTHVRHKRWKDGTHNVNHTAINPLLDYERLYFWDMQST